LSLDNQRFSSIGHGDLPYWNPIDGRALDEVIARIPLTASSRILDIGCGRGRLLLDILQRTGASGVGVDMHELAIRSAAQEANARGIADRVDFTLAAFDPEVHAAEPFDLVVCIGSSHALGGFPDAWPTFQSIIAADGFLLLGEGYWKQPPPAPYLEFLGGSESDLHTYQATSALGTPFGFHPVFQRETTQAEWDAYEDTYAGNLFAFVENHPEDPDAQAIFTRINSWRDAFLRWGRATLGFGLYLQQKKPPSQEG
jgi:SAM-dependent methyltransferase